MRNLILTVPVATALATPVLAQHAHHSASHLDVHAPIGVMGDHTHHEGGWMVSLRAMTMGMEGTDDTFMVRPQDMEMRMTMLGVMYASSDDLTWMLMLPYVEKDMDLDRNIMGGTADFETETSGLGDLKLSAMPVIWRGDRQQVHLNLGISLPTGSITETGGVLQMNGTTFMEMRLPYSMQLGTGTFDLHPGITYLGQEGVWSWGAQASGIFHLGENDEDYSFGDVLSGTTWGTLDLGKNQAVSLRLKATSWEEIDGEDAVIAPMAMMNPMADPSNYGGTRTEVGVGWEWHGAAGDSLEGHRFAAELLLPVSEDLDGPTMETDWTVVFGWQYSF